MVTEADLGLSDGHISVLNYGAAALDWMASVVRRPGG